MENLTTDAQEPAKANELCGGKIVDMDFPMPDDIAEEALAKYEDLKK